jgi:hypothetical protein
MDEADDLADVGGRLYQRMHRVARRHIRSRDAHHVTSVGEHVCRRFRVVCAQVSEQEVLADTDPPRDGLTDLAGANDDDDALHWPPSRD